MLHRRPHRDEHMQEMASTEKSTLSMKLLVNTKAQRVLYAEAGKDVVDFLFSLLTLPVGTVVKLLTANSMVGSVGNLYSSVEKLDDTYVCRNDAKGLLLTPPGGCGGGKLLQLPEAPAVSDGIYRCVGTSYSECRRYVSRSYAKVCPRCNVQMMTQANLVGSDNPASVAAASRAAAAGAGFVQKIVTYTVMDDLKVTPMSNISGITLLNTCRITDIGSLQEKTVQLGYAEGLELLKASFQSKTVLTDVFLRKNRKA